MEQPKEVKMQIRANDETLAGTYANKLIVHMNSEEFTFDFINFTPPHAILNSRVVVSPGNFKQMLHIMKASLERFEKEFRELPACTPTPPPAEFVQ